MCTPVTAAWALVLVEVLVLVTWPTAVAQAARALARQPEPLAALAVRPALLVPHPLPVGCLGKVAVAVVHIMQAQAPQAVLAVVALVVAAVVQHAVHMPQALAVSAVMAGHWWWSIDNAAICRC